jgi:VWFA-related protein
MTRVGLAGRAVIGIVSSAMLTAVGRAQQRSAPASGIAITSPEAGAYASGLALLEASIAPSIAVESATFMVDGRQICTLTQAPYHCEWNAGRMVREHQVRLVVVLKSGERRTVNVRTKGLDFAANTEVQAVQVTVSVINDGKFVTGLKQSAFRVREDGKVQTISAFAAEDAPLELVVAIDISGSVKESLPAIKRAVQRFLDAVPREHHVTVLGFNDGVREIAGRSADPELRRRSVDELEAWGATVLYDTMADGLNRLEQHTGRKALIVFTDGDDAGSRLSFEDIVRRLEASDATVFMIGQGSGVSSERLKKTMHTLAEPTGGRALFFTRIDELGAAFDSLLDELKHQYLLGYQSTNEARDGTWREIRVEVEGRHRVRARRGYRASR